MQLSPALTDAMTPVTTVGANGGMYTTIGSNVRPGSGAKGGTGVGVGSGAWWNPGGAALGSGGARSLSALHGPKSEFDIRLGPPASKLARWVVGEPGSIRTTSPWICANP